MTKRFPSWRITIRGLVGLILTLALATQTAFAKNPSSEHIVARFHHSLMHVMREAKSLGYEGRFKLLRPHIEKNFHIPIMLRIAMGNFWQRATKSQKERLINAFTDISVGTYAARFSGYSGQTFLTKGSRKGPQNTILVDTILRDPSGSDIPLTYITREIQGTWHIIDILLSTGISELAIPGALVEIRVTARL